MTASDNDFVWKGLRFVWSGRQRRWNCERRRHQSQQWWVTHHLYERSFYLRKGESQIDWSAPPPIDHPDMSCFASGGYLAHFGHGDAALRDTREEALDAALQYALRFHHQSIAALREVCFAPEGAS